MGRVEIRLSINKPIKKNIKLINKFTIPKLNIKIYDGYSYFIKTKN